MGAVAAVASVVIQKLTDMLAQQSVLHKRGLGQELGLIKKALEEMGGYFLDAEAGPKRDDQQVKPWIDTYLKHLYDVEDAIDQTLALRLRLRFPCCSSTKLSFPFAAFLKFNRLCLKIKNIRSQIDQLRKATPQCLEDLSVKSTQTPRAPAPANSNHHHYAAHPIQEEEEEQPPHEAAAAAAAAPHLSNHTQSQGFRSMSIASIFGERFNQSKLFFNYSFDEEKLNIVGLKQNGPSLVQALLPTPTTPHSSTNTTRLVVSIVGERGSGKTTLARAVYGNRQVQKHFESFSAWVTAPKGSSTATPDLLLSLLTQITTSQDPGGDHLIFPPGTLALKTRIFDLLKDKRYLIVLDDVDNSGFWDDIRTAFPDQHRQTGSRILLITSDKEIADRAQSRPHQLEKLNESDSWNLFLKKAGIQTVPEFPQSLKNTILQICNCLPLNIVLLGSLLSTITEYGKWPEILDSRSSWETQDLISLSYDDLPPPLKLCLIYMVLFPKEFDIPVRRLQRLWLAEGFVTLSGTKTFQEDAVRRYFDDLVQRSLIQVSKLASDGSPKKCRLLGVLHDHLIPKAQDISLFHVHNGNSHNSCQVKHPVFLRRLVEYTDIKNCSLVNNPSTKPASLRSYLSFNIQKKDTPATEVGKLLSSILNNGSRLLRVLDLEGVYKPSLPDSLGDFFHLRYLGLRWTFLDTLPESVGRLHYLETLDIKHTYISSLPPFIWKLKHLKHINANGVHLDLPMHSCSSLPQLMTLSGFSVDERSLKKDGCLENLVHIRELEITVELKNPEKILDWILKLTAIQKLRLRSKQDMGRPSRLILKPLSSLKNLTHLYLLGNLLPGLPDEGFPRELKVLTLAVSELEKDPMPTLGKLPKLTVLRLLANSYLRETMTCPAGGFPELRVLKLWMLKNLEHWTLEEEAMKKLKEINIRCCNKLKEIPRKLVEQINQLTLTNMSAEFKSQVEGIIPHRLEIITYKNYDFSPLPWDGVDGSSDQVNSMSMS